MGAPSQCFPGYAAILSSLRSHQLRSMGMCLSRRNEKPSTYVEEEFQKGKFVVKGSGCRKFNQVDPDHSQEWLNGTGKRGGGIVGSTKTTTALSRWTLSFNFRAQISAQTRQMLNGGDGNAIVHNEATPGSRGTIQMKAIS